MEIVLLWLDDLDDLVLCCGRLWEPVRYLCLQIGLGAAFALSAAELLRGEWSAALAAVAATSVSLWFCGAACAIAARLRLVRRPAFA